MMARQSTRIRKAHTVRGSWAAALEASVQDGEGSDQKDQRAHQLAALNAVHLPHANTHTAVSKPLVHAPPSSRTTLA